MTAQELQALKNKFDIIGNDHLLNRALEIAVAVASTDLTVLISGESGVGKENIPKIIHQYSRRRTGKYFAVNCGAIPEGTIDSELFGHEKGSFTGASEMRKGYFEEADGGTLFLDEVGELPLASQAKLLRVLQSGEFIRVGSSKVLKTDVRVVAATNVNLKYAVAKGKFREDLYYRLNAVSIYMPPLSEELRMADGDFKLVEKRRKAMYRNMRDHNLLYPLVDRRNRGGLPDAEAEKLFRNNLEWMRDCGLATNAVFGGVGNCDWYLVFRKPEQRPAGYEENFFRDVDRDLAAIRSVMGKETEVYSIGWDEPGMKLLVGQRPFWRKIHDRGMKILSTAKDRHLRYGAYNEDFANYAGTLSPESARIWHAMGNRITNYANPHTGPENPDYIRRSHGMALYKADYDGSCNYHFLENGTGNVWRDTNSIFRTFAFVYPTADGVLDTLHYEGFRAGIDDIRYATKLRLLAEEAIARKNTDAYYAGKKALRFLALAQADRVNLDTLRMEMIEQILKLRDALSGASRNKER